MMGSDTHEYVPLYGRKDFADVIKVHNQLTFLQQKECSKTFYYSYFNIILRTTQIPIHLPTLQSLGSTKETPIQCCGR